MLWDVFLIALLRLFFCVVFEKRRILLSFVPSSEESFLSVKHRCDFVLFCFILFKERESVEINL